MTDFSDRLLGITRPYVGKKVGGSRRGGHLVGGYL